MSSLFAPLGTACSTHNDGEATVVYDPLADRWLLSQYCTNFPPFRQMIAVSKTGDPTGAYFLYEFVMPNFKLNDWAKFGVWPDGYYMSTDEFIGSDFQGSGVFAFDRSKDAGGRSDRIIYLFLSAVVRHCPFRQSAANRHGWFASAYCRQPKYLCRLYGDRIW